MSLVPAPVRLALILTEFPPSFGGMQTHAEFLAQALQAAGYQVCVYTYRCDDPQLVAGASEFDRNTGYPVRRILSRLGFWANQRALLKALRREKTQLIYASNVYYGLLGAELAIPVICRSVGNDVQRPWIAYPFRFASQIVSHPLLERSLYRWYRRWNTPEWIELLLRQQRKALMQRSARANNTILANSDYTRQLLGQVGVAMQSVRVLAGGVDTQRFTCNGAERAAVRLELGIAADVPLLFTACRLVAKKGIDFLLAQILALRCIAPDLRLLIVGDGREKRRCIAQLTAAGVAEYVIFSGKVPQHSIQRYFAAADYFVLASRITTHRVSGLQDAETMGRVLCEANAAGLPVLASRSGGIPSVVTHEDNGLLFESDNAADFLQQFRRLHEDTALREQLIQRGRQRAEQEYDWSVLIAAHQQCFVEALQGAS